MKPLVALSQNRRFKQIYQYGKSYPGPFVVLYVMPNKQKMVRVGFTVSKKVGKAVVRNHVRRRIFESVRVLTPMISNHVDLIFVARIRAQNASFWEIDKNIRKLLTQANLLLEDKKG